MDMSNQEEKKKEKIIFEKTKFENYRNEMKTAFPVPAKVT